MNNMNYKENNNNKEFLERYAVNLNQRARASGPARGSSTPSSAGTRRSGGCSRF